MKYFESFYTISEHLDFIKEWKGLTYGFEGITKHNGLRIPTDMIYKSVDPLGRRLLMRGSRLGNIVLFERFAPGQGPKVIFCTLPPMFLTYARDLPPSNFEGVLNDCEMNYLIQGDF